MKLYEVKALAHETQSRIRQDLNAWNDFLEHASRVYRYRFMDQILIYAQRPDAVACATMNIWNSKMGCWIKKGNRGIALIDESNSRKLKYVWDVTSVVPKMGGHLPRLWIRKTYHTETIQNRLLKVYGLQPQTDKYDTKEPSIEHTMDYLVEYLADEYAADIAQEKYSSDNSPLSELDEEKYKMDEYRRNVRFFFRYGLNRMIKERMGLSTGGFPDYDMSFIKDMPESDFCELSSRMTDAAQQALREVGIAVLTYDRVHGIDRDPSVDYNALKRKSAEREDKTYGTRIHQSRGLRDTEPYTEQGTTGAADEIRTYAQDLAEKELQGEVRYDANVRGTSGTLPKGTEESTGRDGQNRAADEKTGRSDRAAEDAGPAEMDTNDEQHPEQGRGNSEGYSDLHFVENEIVPESGTDEDEYVPESGTGLYFMPELPTEDEQRIKVDKYGYLNPRKADYIPHDYIRQVMLRGTGFEGGFDRVVQIFQNEMEAGKRTALIKKEYGLGGASWPVDGMGLHGYDTYGSQGIRFQWRDEQGEAEGTLSWSSVEQEIGTLILTGEYKSRDRQNNDIIPEAEESDNISQTTEMQEQSTDKHKSEAPEQLSFTDLTNIEPDKTENDTQPEALDETEAEQKDNAEQQNNEDFTERAADYTALLVLAEADASTLTKRQKAQRNISALKILKQIENEKRPATADERTIMSAYLGWGGIPEIFDAENASWSEEYGILKSLLTTTEYDSARASTLNAHFTDKSVIDAMYKVLNNLGFTKGNILEPSMGIGNFFSRLPADMSASRLYGVELDPVTGKMAQLIYPDAHIDVKGYEKTDFQNDFFDVAIGNVPFGQYKVLDKAYDKHNFYIHDYFFAKTIDKVRPGGVIAFITSKGTLDKANPSVRRYMAQRTQLLGAIRLPNNAFKNAGTSVTSDIIFLKKRDMYIDTDEDWIHLGTDENGIEMNSYFVNNPHMVLGKMEMVSGPHGMESACVPESGTWQTSEEYLSGNIRKKLISAEKALQGDASYSDNVEYLKKAMPKPLTASEIEVRLGATWINAEYIEQFMKDVLHTPQRLFSREWVAVKFAPINCEWNIKGKNADSFNPLVTGTYGTGRINAYQILENTLNLKDVKVYDRIPQPDGSEKRVVNREQTMLASQKQDALKEAFKDWIFRDPERREVLVKKYNELFNSSRPRTYDGSHLKFPGMTPDVELKPHQLNAVAHVMYGDNTLLAHCVGAGKTFEMIASAMESKRLGLCHKSLFVVPNHLTEQWAGDFLRLYPGANILAATEKDFEPARRKRFCARIATGDYDAVIIGHTQFAKIPLSDERQKRLMQEQIDEITESISEAKASNGEHFTIKQMEKTKKNLEVRLAKLNDAGRKDNAVTFEQLGVDRLFVDESQEFKNLFLFTKMRNVAGISQNDSQKASDMYGKCRYIDEITGDRGITFATGTPISNSMTELYTNMRYLQASRLKELGFENFDAWASTFGETQTAIELAPEGTGYRAKTRFAKFFNLPELISLFKESADIQTADMLKLPVPECDYENVVLKPSEFQQEIVKSLGDRAENIRNGGVDSSIDNMLKVTSDGRKCAIDQRLINPELPDNENSKVNACAARAYDIWKETTKDKSTQLIFCDASTPRSDGGFDVYHAIKDKLIAKGVPDKEIAFIHDANTKKQKAELFSKVRSGQVRFLLGSTAKMGAGTNVQTRLIALHHIDVPWRPSDIEQQEGRILRQGNRNERVKIFRYVTENTFDSYSWQLIENKQKFIGQIMTSKSPVRSCDDVDEAALSYAEVKALATGNPYIKEKMTLDTEVAKLKLLKANFKSQKYRLEDAINKEYPVRIAKLEEKIEGLRQDIITRGSEEILSDGFEIRINGVLYDDKKEGGAALIAAAKESKTPERTMIGDYKGFKLYSRFDAFFNLYYIHMQGRCEHTIEMSSDPAGMITRLNNCMAGFEKRLSDAQDALDETRIELETAEKEVTKKFDKEDILSEKLKRLSFLNAQLDADRKETPQNAPQNKQAQRNDIKEKYISI